MVSETDQRFAKLREDFLLNYGYIRWHQVGSQLRIRLRGSVCRGSAPVAKLRGPVDEQSERVPPTAPDEAACLVCDGGTSCSGG